MMHFLSGNHIQLLRSGEEYFPALTTAIENANNSIYLQTYIYEIDKAGISIGNVLKQAAQRGVSVNILLDGFGCKDMPKAYLKELENAGVQVMFYRQKISPWTLKKNRLRRLHRKIAVVDNKIAFVGGINIIDDYNVPDNTPPRIDYAVRIEGALLPSIAASVYKLWRRMEPGPAREEEGCLDRNPGRSPGDSSSWRLRQEAPRLRRGIRKIGTPRTGADDPGGIGGRSGVPPAAIHSGRGESAGRAGPLRPWRHECQGFRTDHEGGPGPGSGTDGRKGPQRPRSRGARRMSRRMVESRLSS